MRFFTYILPIILCISLCAGLIAREPASTGRGMSAAATPRPAPAWKDSDFQEMNMHLSYLSYLFEEADVEQIAALNSDQFTTLFCRATGIDLPEGTTVRYDPKTGRVTVRFLRWSNPFRTYRRSPFTNVRVRVWIAQFDQQRLDQLDRQLPGGLNGEVLAKLWRAGEGKTVFKESLVTVSGVNAVNERVEDVSYPVASASKDKETGKEKVNWQYEPRLFGHILNATPQVNPDNRTINLILVPEAVVLNGNRENIPARLREFLPLFSAMNLSTQVVVDSGSTLAVATVTSPDGKHRNVILVSASLEDPIGRTVRNADHKKLYKEILTEVLADPDLKGTPANKSQEQQ